MVDNDLKDQHITEYIQIAVTPITSSSRQMHAKHNIPCVVVLPAHLRYHPCMAPRVWVASSCTHVKVAAYSSCRPSCHQDSHSGQVAYLSPCRTPNLALHVSLETTCSSPCCSPPLTASANLGAAILGANYCLSASSVYRARWRVRAGRRA